jgi:hypothetical protein
MELITSPKSTYLLEAGLEVLHEQSTEWLNEIAFWRDEAAFFYSLVVTKTKKSVPENLKEEFSKVEKELISVTADELDKLEESVTEHEKFLRYLVDCQEKDQTDYRNKHKMLALSFEQFEKRFKSLKKNVFSLVEKIGQLQ